MKGQGKRERKKNKQTKTSSLSQSSKLGKITTLLGQDFSPEVHFQGNADPQERGSIVILKPAKNLQSDPSSYFHYCVKAMPHILSELLLCVAK